MQITNRKTKQINKPKSMNIRDLIKFNLCVYEIIYDCVIL